MSLPPLQGGWNSDFSRVKYVVFAFLCTLFLKNSEQRAIENAGRQPYCAFLAIHTTTDRSSLTPQFNEAGNCPEFSTWGDLRHGRGVIRSHRLIKCGSHREDTADGAALHYR